MLEQLVVAARFFADFRFSAAPKLADSGLTVVRDVPEEHQLKLTRSGVAIYDVELVA